MIRLTLTSEGFDVVTANNGVHALEQLDHGSNFDAILLDLQMPVMDGRTFYREMRARGIGTPVIILSAYGAEAAKEELHAEAAVSKPFDPDFLLAVTHELIGASA
jgi:CheY-like chemotaxis protein